MSAPDAPRAPKAPRGGRLAWWPFLVALIAVLVVVGITLALGAGSTGSRQDGTALTKSGAVACPEFFERANQTDPSKPPWVPAVPAGNGGSKRLVPKLKPTHVTVCAYLDKSSGARPKSLRLTGQHELTGNLDRVTDTLIKAPKKSKAAVRCALYVRPADRDAYLIGMRYAEGIVWVSTPGNHCLGAGNGEFETGRNLSAYAAAAYRARTWVSSPG